jgi:hypothetical protein
LTNLPKSLQAYALASLLQSAARIPQTMLTFSTYAPVKKGDVISLDDTSLGISGIFPVLDVTASGVLRVYQVTAGYERPTQGDLLNGPRMKLLQLAAAGITRNRAGAGPNFNNPNAPTRILNGAPDSSYQNAVQALTDQTVAFGPRSAGNRGKVTPDDMPIGTSTDNFSSAAVAEPPLRPVAGTNYFPRPRYLLRQTLPDGGEGPAIEWDKDDGSNGPWSQHYEFDEDGHADVYYPVKVLISTVAVTREYDENNVRVVPMTTALEAHLLLEDLTSHAMLGLTPLVSATDPLYLVPGATVDDDRALQVEISGLPPGHTAKVVVSELGIDLRYWGLI